MKLKFVSIALLFLFFSVSAFARPLADSIGVKNNDGKKMIVFKVRPKDTYYSIARRYSIKPAALMKFNGSKKGVLSIGQIIYIPTEIPYRKSKSKRELAEIHKKESIKEKKARLEKEAREEHDAKLEEDRKRREQEQAIIQHTDEQQSAANTAPDQPAQEPQPVQTSQTVQPNVKPIQYKISAGETLYSISRRFNTSVYDITQINKLKSTTLVPGRILLVRPGVQTQPGMATQQDETADNQPAQKNDSTPKGPYSDSVIAAERHVNAAKFGLFEKNEEGVATWMDDPGLDSSKKLVLHRTAPIGTVIKITNPMTNRTTFAKVVGRFTDTQATKDVILVMTKNVADSLGALDKRFRVEISYGSPNE